MTPGWPLPSSSPVPMALAIANGAPPWSASRRPPAVLASRPAGAPADSAPSSRRPAGSATCHVAPLYPACSRPGPVQGSRARDTRPGCAAMRKRRQRRCGAPKAAAGIPVHHASNPRSARSARTADRPVRRRPGTFSMRTNDGTVASMTAAAAGHSHRSSLVPSLRPAALCGWQGIPPQMRSILGLGSLAHHSAAVRMSSCRGRPGQCAARIWRHHGSISACPRMAMRPVRSRPRSSPPIPLHKDSAFRSQGLPAGFLSTPVYTDRAPPGTSEGVPGRQDHANEPGQARRAAATLRQPQETPC